MIRANIFDNFDFNESEFVKFVFLAKHAVSSHRALYHKVKNNQSTVNFNKGQFGYQYQYSGGFGLDGRETVSHDGIDCWSMTSESKIHDEKVPDDVKNRFNGYSISRIHFFLKRMLRETPRKLPIRGPDMMEGTMGGQRLRYSLKLTEGIDLTYFMAKERIDLLAIGAKTRAYSVLTSKIEGGLILPN